MWCEDARFLNVLMVGIGIWFFKTIFSWSANATLEKNLSGQITHTSHPFVGVFFPLLNQTIKTIVSSRPLSILLSFFLSVNNDISLPITTTNNNNYERTTNAPRRFPCPFPPRFMSFRNCRQTKPKIGKVICRQNEQRAKPPSPPPPSSSPSTKLFPFL